MNKKLEGLLRPKQNALVGKEKPRVLIISDPSGKPDCATRFSLAKQYLEDIGYYVLNKTRITFEDNTDTFSIKPIHPAKKIIIWYIAHGAPGWLFSSKPGIEEEERERNSFIRYVQSLSWSIKTSIDAIVLHSCYSATEYAKRNSSAYFASPARFISSSFNDVPVVGFIGTNSSTCVSGVFLKTGEGQFDSVLIKAVDGAVLFLNGEIRVADAQPYFCNRSSIPLFLRAGTPLSQYFEICTRAYAKEEQKAPARERFEKSKPKVKAGFKFDAAASTTSADDEELANIMKLINEERSATSLARLSASTLIEPVSKVSVSHCSDLGMTSSPAKKLFSTAFAMTSAAENPSSPKLSMALPSPTQKLSSLGLFAPIASIDSPPSMPRKSVSFWSLNEEHEGRLSGMNNDSPSKYRRSLLLDFNDESTSDELTRSIRSCSR